MNAERPTRVRYWVVFAATMMAVLLYLDRFCVSFAADYIREDLSLTQTQVSWFLSAFFWSYALAQVPSGWLSDRYGARIMLVIYVLTWSLFTALIGAVYSFALLLLTRLATGLGQAGAYPTSASIVSKWTPFTARGTASSIIAFGGRCGGAIAPLLTAWLIVLFIPADAPLEFTPENLLDGSRLVARIAPPAKPGEKHESAAGERVWHLLTNAEKGPAPLSAENAESLRIAAEEYRRWEKRPEGKRPTRPDLSSADRDALLAGLNELLARSDLYEERAFGDVKFVREALQKLKRLQAGDELSETELKRLNRLLLEAAFPRELGKLYVRGWRPVMVVYGLSGLLVAALLWFMLRSRPEAHPWTNAAEQQLIAAGRPEGAPGPHGKPGMAPIGRLVKSRSMWFVCVSQVGTNIGWLFLVTWLPRYLMEMHQVPILERGVMAMTPLLVGIVGMLCGGWLTDRLTRAFGVKWGRRLPMMITRFTAAMAYLFCLWLSTQSGGLNNAWAFTIAFSIVAMSTDMGTAAVWAFKQDVGGRHVGSILGWGNMWGNLGASVSPLIYNAVLGEHPAVGDWNVMFGVCAAAFVVSGVCALGVDATIPIAPPDED